MFAGSQADAAGLRSIPSIDSGRRTTKTAPEEPMMGEAEADPVGAANASVEPGTMQVLLTGEDV